MCEAIGHSVVAAAPPHATAASASGAGPGGGARAHAGRDRGAAHPGAGQWARRPAEPLPGPRRARHAPLRGAARAERADRDRRERPRRSREPVEPGATVTLDGNPLEAAGGLRRPGARCRAARCHRWPIPPTLHVAGVSKDERPCWPERRASWPRRSLAQGYDPGRAGRRRARAGRVPAALAGRARGGQVLRAAPGSRDAVDCLPHAQRLRQRRLARDDDRDARVRERRRRAPHRRADRGGRRGRARHRGPRDHGHRRDRRPGPDRRAAARGAARRRPGAAAAQGLQVGLARVLRPRHGDRGARPQGRRHAASC